MRRDLKRSIIVIVSLMAFESITSVEDDNEALEKFNHLLNRYPRMTFSEIETSSSRKSNSKRELELKLSNLLEFSPLEAKWPVERKDIADDDETDTTVISKSEVSPFMRFEPADENEKEEFTSDEDDDENNEIQRTKKHPEEIEHKHAKLVKKIRQKLSDRQTKFAISLPVAIIGMASIIFVTCCCTLYLRNRLIACMNIFTRKNKIKSKMLTVDTERGRMIPRNRKKSVEIKPSSKQRARSLSQDIPNIEIQKSNTITTAKDVEDTQSAGCFKCCRKKKKRAKKSKK